MRMFSLKVSQVEYFITADFWCYLNYEQKMNRIRNAIEYLCSTLIIDILHIFNEISKE